MDLLKFAGSATMAVAVGGTAFAIAANAEPCARRAAFSYSQVSGRYFDGPVAKPDCVTVQFAVAASLVARSASPAAPAGR
jgi:hypothetical protein